MLYTFLAILLVHQGYCAYDADEVVNLPGLKYRFDFKQYSGYLDTSLGQIHYWFVEAKEDAKNKPLLIWLNGGPGCSSMMGLFTENGPVLFNRDCDRSEEDLFELNPYTWNNVNIVLLNISF